jgi:hypothetical protein
VCIYIPRIPYVLSLVIMMSPSVVFGILCGLLLLPIVYGCIEYHPSSNHLQSSHVEICPHMIHEHQKTTLNYTICHDVKYQLVFVDTLVLTYQGGTHTMPICHHPARHSKMKHDCQQQLLHSNCLKAVIPNIPIAYSMLQATSQLQIRSHNGTVLLYTYDLKQ